MKKYFVLFSMMAAFSAQASEKICFWMSGSNGSKGDKFIAKISTAAVTISSASESVEPYKGRHKYLGKLEGRNGVSYRVYDLPSLDGYNEELIVDEDLVRNGTKGVIKMRARGEGYFEEKYFCRDTE